VGVQKSQTLDYQIDSQAFCVKNSKNTEGAIFRKNILPLITVLLIFAP
jgi:hypothetical protein